MAQALTYGGNADEAEIKHCGNAGDRPLIGNRYLCLGSIPLWATSNTRDKESRKIALCAQLEATASGAKPKSPGRRKPKEPIPQPEPVAEAAKATHPEYVPAPAEASATKANAAKQKPAVGKAKASKSKRTEAELVEVLQKTDIQI